MRDASTMDILISLRDHVLGEQKKRDRVEDWWVGLGKLKQKKVSTSLGLPVSMSSLSWEDLKDTWRDELSAYFSKHRGKIVEDDFNYGVGQ